MSREPETMTSAFVFNCAFNGLNVIQELGRRGIEVYALDSFRNVGTVSRYAEYMPCPNAAVDPDEFVSFLLDVADDFDDKPVLFPTNDHWAAAIAQHRSKLADEYRPCVATESVVDLLLDKHTFCTWARSRGISAPRSWRMEELDALPEDEFPVAAKPNNPTKYPDMMFESKLAVLYNRWFGTADSVDSKRDEIETGKRLLGTQLEVLGSREDLDRFIKAHEAIADEFVLQDYIAGMSDRMYTVGLYANEGHVKGIFTGRKVRGFPPDFGDCKVGQVEDVPDELVLTAQEVCTELEYTGIAEFEFKRDSDTGKFSLIEVNPRSWSWIGITPDCGVSLPWIAYEDLTGNDVHFTTQSVDSGSVQWVKATEDLPNCLVAYRFRGFDEWSLGPIAWLRSIQSKRTVFAELASDDPLPGVYAVLLVIRRGLLGLTGSAHQLHGRLTHARS